MGQGPCALPSEGSLSCCAPIGAGVPNLLYWVTSVLREPEDRFCDWLIAIERPAEKRRPEVQAVQP